MNGPKTSRTLRTKKLFREIYLFLFNDLLVICRQIPGWVQNLGSTQDISLVYCPSFIQPVMLWPHPVPQAQAHPLAWLVHLPPVVTIPLSTADSSWVAQLSPAENSWLTGVKQIPGQQGDYASSSFCRVEMSYIGWWVTLSRSDFWLIASWRTAQI